MRVGELFFALWTDKKKYQSADQHQHFHGRTRLQQVFSFPWKGAQHAVGDSLRQDF